MDETSAAMPESTEVTLDEEQIYYNEQQHKRYLRPREIAAYVLTSFGQRNVTSFVDSWKQYFMMNFIGISGGAYGKVNLITSIWDALDDPLSGIIIDRMRTRWGRIRPFMIAPLPLMVVTTMMFFIVPWFLLPAQRVIYAVVGSILYSIGWSYYGAWGLLLYNITPNNNERDRLIATQKFVDLFGIWIPSMVSPCVDFIPKISNIEQQSIYSGFSVFFLIILVITSFFGFFNIRERVPLASKEDLQKTSIIDSFKIVLKNRPLFVLLLADFFGGFKGTVGGASESFFWLNCTGKLTHGTICGLFTGTPNFIITPMTPKIIRRFGARNTAIGAGVFGGIAYFAFFLIGYAPTGNNIVNLAWIFFALTVCGLPNCVMGICDPVLKGDMYDYLEWKSGMRNEGLVNAVSGYITKLSKSIQGFLSGYIFEIINYVPLKDSLGNIIPQTDEQMLGGIFAIFALAPAVARFGYGISLFLFNVHGSFKEKMLEDLAVRRTAKVIREQGAEE